jgi:uncharacterized protein YggU (UPF0235/DUF167 family)
MKLFARVKANAAVIELLAEHLKLSKNALTINRGRATKET